MNYPLRRAGPDLRDPTNCTVCGYEMRQAYGKFECLACGLRCHWSCRYGAVEAAFCQGCHREGRED